MTAHIITTLLAVIKLFNFFGGIMIYSHDIDRICSLCKYYKANADTIHCIKHKKKTDITPISDACKHFSYDIFKKTVHRKKPLKTDFNPDDFKL